MEEIVDSAEMTDDISPPLFAEFFRVLQIIIGR